MPLSNVRTCRSLLCTPPALKMAPEAVRSPFSERIAAALETVEGIENDIRVPELHECFVAVRQARTALARAALALRRSGDAGSGQNPAAEIPPPYELGS